MNMILFKLIASAPNGLDTVSVFVCLLNFVTQAVDMDCKSGGVAEGIITPNAFKKLCF